MRNEDAVILTPDYDPPGSIAPQENNNISELNNPHVATGLFTNQSK